MFSAKGVSRPPAPNGQTTAYKVSTQTSYSITVPANVYQLCAVLVQQGNPQSAGNKGGNGGNLRWMNNIPVTPGEVLTLLLAETGTGHSYLKRGSTVLLASNTPLGNGVGGGNGGNGALYYTLNGGAGGGAGGYNGNGGNAGITSTAGTGGAGSGGRTSIASSSVGSSYSYGDRGGDGGGVGLFGQGADGAAITTTGTNTTGNPGSGGTAQDCGGGQGAQYARTDGTYGPAGIQGMAGGRCIWGDGRAFPSTKTGDL